MKTAALIVALAITAGTVSVASADDKTKDTKATSTANTAPAAVEKPKATTEQQPQYVYGKTKDRYLTGSYIKKEVRRTGLITDGPSPVLVYNQKTIEDSGAGDLRELLIKRGIH